MNFTKGVLITNGLEGTALHYDLELISDNQHN